VDRDDRPRIVLTLWKRELLVGHMEVDDELKVRRGRGWRMGIVGEGRVRHEGV
jgi:hypothetical protein